MNASETDRSDLDVLSIVSVGHSHYDVGFLT